MKVGIIIFIILAIAALVVCFAPLISIAYIVNLEYQTTETYYEDEPYQDIEIYYETMPLNYEVLDSFVREKKGNPCGYVEVQNLDEAAGLFTVEFSFSVGYTSISPGSIVLSSRTYKTNEELYLEPDQTKTARHREDNINMDDNWSWSYEVTPDTKSVEHQRTVTKYRQVEQERLVTTYRTETRHKKVTILDYLLHY